MDIWQLILYTNSSVDGQVMRMKKIEFASVDGSLLEVKKDTISVPLLPGPGMKEWQVNQDIATLEGQRFTRI